MKMKYRENPGPPWLLRLNFLPRGDDERQLAGNKVLFIISRSGIFGCARSLTHGRGVVEPSFGDKYVD